MGARKKRVLLGVTGSIAAYKACDITNRLKERSFEVTVVMTDEAARFISPLTLENLSGNKVITDMWAPVASYDPLHTSLAENSDIILIAPATANVIGKIANGVCDDILTCTVLAAKSPVLIAPAMNDRMYNHKAVAGNIEKLKKWGYIFVGPKTGRLACGYSAMGHIADTDDIVKQVKKIL